MAPRWISEQLGHGDGFGLRLAFAAPDYIRDSQSFGCVVAAEKHGNETGHLAGMVFADRPSTKRTYCARIIFTEPTFHDLSPGLCQIQNYFSRTA
jgi:hypothetical protein